MNLMIHHRLKLRLHLTENVDRLDNQLNLIFERSRSVTYLRQFTLSFSLST
jgi:hypothetical protein